MSAATLQFLLRLMVMAIVTAWPASSRGAAEALGLPTATGGTDYLVQNWQSDEGLPRNTISSIVQDQQGYLWMGTPYGLIRFDGVRFVALEAGAAPNFAQGYVQQLRCDSAGDVWIATRRSGLFRCRDGIIISESPAWPASAVDSVAEDGRGGIWVTDGTGGLGRLQDGKFVRTAELWPIAAGPMLFKLTTDAAGGLWFYKQDTFGRVIDGQPTNYVKLPGQVITLEPGRDGGMWISTGTDLRRMPPGQPAAIQVVTPLDFGIYGVSALLEDRTGSLWIGTVREGLYRFDGNTLDKIDGVHHHIQDILEDAEGNIWVGTDGAGLFKVRPRHFQIHSVAGELPREAVVSVCGDWVAPQGGGLGRFGPSGAVDMLPEFDRNNVTSLMEDGAGGVWLGTAGSRLIHCSPEGAIERTLTVWPGGTQLRVLHRDHAGNLWVGCFPAGLFVLPSVGPQGLEDMTTRGFPRVAVTAMAEDGAGVVWIGTAEGGLHCLTNDTFRSFGVAEGFSRFAIGALLPATNGGLWVGTLGGGLGRFENGRIRFLGRNEGLVDDVVSQLVEDDSGWLWMGSSRGISRVRPGEVEAVLAGRKHRMAPLHYGQSDGLANVHCMVLSQPSAWRTSKGLLRFATSRGVVSVDPAALPVNFRPPPLVLESILVDGAPITDENEVRLPHNFNKLEFRYTAMSFVAPEKVLFRRRLVGFDEGWIEDGTARAATYPRLPPGSYVFQFTACNNDGVWNDEEFRLHFEVLPAVWQEGWFRAGVVLFFAAWVAGAARYLTKVRMRRKLQRVEQAHALERERTRISRDLHDDLGARLTQMALLTDLAADDAAATPEVKTQLLGVSQQARSAVQSLDETVWMINPQKDTLAHLIGYIARYAEKFFQPTAISCRLSICPHPPDCTVAGNLRQDIFFVVKEALHNVLKHSGATEVWLRIAVRGPVLRIVIEDDGKGFSIPHLNRTRHGLDNMRNRAETAGLKLRLHSVPGQGTRLTLRVRLPANLGPA